MNRRHLISQFSPQRSDPADLEKMLVQRHGLLAASVDKIRESILTGNKHHLLFIGPRGAGKTHLVTLIHHRLSQQTDVTDKFRFAWLNEDETSTSFLKLLIRISFFFIVFLVIEIIDTVPSNFSSRLRKVES